MRKTALSCVALASLFVLALPGNAAAARAIDHFHTIIGPETFDNNICGVEGISVLRGVATITTFSDGTISDNFQISQTFTNPETNQSIVEHIAEHSNYLVDNPVDNGDGTVTFTFTFRGLPEQIRISHGPVLTRNAGTVTVATTLAVDEDGNPIAFVSQTLSGVHGPHPDFLDGFENFCDVIVDALT
jgi:hypothetical protein